MRTISLVVRHSIAALATLTVVSVVRAKEPISVVLDSWWNDDYAKNYCQFAGGWYKETRPLIAQFGYEAVTSCTDWMPIVQACQINDPVANVRDFEVKLMTYLAADPQCKGVHFTRFIGPGGRNTTSSADAMERDDSWTLFLDYKPGATKQAWDLIRKKPETFTKGEGDPKAIAKSVCAITTNQGTTLD